MDWAYYNAAEIGAVRREGARFPVTAIPEELRLDRHQVPTRDLGRPAGHIDLRRRGRRLGSGWGETEPEPGLAQHHAEP